MQQRFLLQILLLAQLPVNQHPANRTHNPQLHTRPATWKTTVQNTTRSNHCIILLSSWWWAWWCPKHVEQAIRSAIKTSVASSWHFISTQNFTFTTSEAPWTNVLRYVESLGRISVVGNPEQNRYGNLSCRRHSQNTVGCCECISDCVPESWGHLVALCCVGLTCNCNNSQPCGGD